MLLTAVLPIATAKQAKWTFTAKKNIFLLGIKTRMRCHSAFGLVIVTMHEELKRS
jgi:hypothetical protein